MSANRPRRSRAHALLALAASSLPLPVLAQSWVGGDGNWSDPAHWTNSNVPGQYAIAQIGGGSNPQSLTVTYDYTGPDVELTRLYVDNRGTGTYALAVDANTLSFQQLYVGNQGRGVLNQSGGNVVASYAVHLGFNAGSSGIYNLSGGTLTTPATGSPGLGMGYGTFNHSGGTHTVGSLGVGGTSQNPSSYVMTGSAVLAADDVYIGSVGPGRFDQRGGTATVTGTLNIIGGTNGVCLLSGGTLTAAVTVNRGGFTQTGGAASLGAISGTGTMVVGGTGSLTATSIRLPSLTLESGGTVGVTPGGGTNGASRVSQLSLAPGARFDLADNALVLDYTGASPIGSIRAAVAAGTLTSTLAGPSAVLGYAEAANVLSSTGGTFAGQSADGTALLVRLTRLGDANLDGTVNFDDLLRLAKNYNHADADWQDGDFNRDGAVNFDDLLALAKNYNTTAPAAPLPGASAAFGGDIAAAFAAVPEPSVAVLGFAACSFALTACRRRPNPAAL